MPRNFGFRPPDRNGRAPVWPIWAVTLMVIGVINVAVFLHHH
jgi:hypothetical protein